MNKMITGLFAAVVIASPAFADVGAPAPTAKDLEKVVEKVNYVETAKEGVKLSGYVDAGYLYNFTGGGSVINGRPAVDAQSKGDFSLNAVKLTLEKPLSKANEFQAGFRADIKFGEDATLLGGNTSAAGSSDNFSLDQAYVIIRAPIGNGLDITVGKFASLLGYEVDDRPANLNITYGYDWQFTTTHQTGVKFYYPVNDIVELQLAVSNGSGLDSTATTGGIGGLNDTAEDSVAVNATINIKAPGGNANWFNGVYAATNAADGFTSDNEESFIWNSWGNWAPKFANDKLLLGFSSNLGYADDEATDNNSQTFWTGSLYAKYQFTDIFSLAGRGSYFHSSDDDGVTLGDFETSGRASTGSNDLYSFTLTAGFDLLENLLLRAEYRADFGHDITGNTNNNSSDLANTVAFQAVYTF